MSDLVEMMEGTESYHSVKDWTTAITAAWQKSVTAIIEAGQLLIAAKASLPHGEWMKMIRTELPFKQSTVNKLMSIARHPLLTKSELATKLPASWATLHELSLLPAPRLKSALKEGLINPRTERPAVRALRPDFVKSARKPAVKGNTSPTRVPTVESFLALPEGRRIDLICEVIAASWRDLSSRSRAKWQMKLSVATPMGSPSIVPRKMAA